MFIIEIISSILLLNLGQFIAIIPAIIISITSIYIESKDIIKSIFIVLVSIFIAIISHYTINYIFMSVFKVNIEVKTIDIYWKFYLSKLLLVFIISRIIGIIINKSIKKVDYKFKGKVSLVVVISLVLTFIIFYSNIILGSKIGFKYDIIKVNVILFWAYFIMLLVIMYILFTSIKRELKSKNKQALYENLHEYTNNLEKLYTDMRKFKHDYTNILSSMVGYMESSDMEGLKKHFNENIIPLERKMETNNFKLGVLKNIKIPEIKGILSSKLIMAQGLGIDTFIEITESVEYINMDILDISRVIGILLDNAIEASQKCDKFFIKLVIINRETSLIIFISNSYSEIIQPIHKIYEKGFSTKGDNRGLGLNILKDITNKYEHVYVDTEIQSREFKQHLEIGRAMESEGVVNA
jgi:two-component system sensor histidine kinase AgrC